MTFSSTLNKVDCSVQNKTSQIYNSLVFLIKKSTTTNLGQWLSIANKREQFLWGHLGTYLLEGSWWGNLLLPALWMPLARFGSTRRLFVPAEAVDRSCLLLIWMSLLLPMRWSPLTAPEVDNVDDPRDPSVADMDDDDVSNDDVVCWLLSDWWSRW